MELNTFILAIIIGTLAAIVYSLRVLLILERRVARMEQNIQRVTNQILTKKRVTKKVKRKR